LEQFGNRPDFGRNENNINDFGAFKNAKTIAENALLAQKPEPLYIGIEMAES
jgi:hypothetical protein